MDYRLYLIWGGRIRDVVDIRAADASAALAKAEKQAAGSAAELWCESRRVGTFCAASAA